MEQFFLIKNKRGQVWSLDLIIASVIFVSAIVILYVYAINYSSQTKNQLDELIYEGNLASQLILSDKNFGILSDGKINQTKLEEFYNFDYQTQKSKFGLVNDFYFTIDGLEINGSSVDYIGRTNSTEIESLMKVTRLAVYKNSPTKFELFVWNTHG